MKKISLIIPVYNVEKYIERCLMSCLKQNIPASEYEIVVVNDGTPDDSMSIVERIAKQYTNIRIINQVNQGLSAARNVGTSVAVGEYIWYIDSDDYIEENCLGRITKRLIDNLDILHLQYRLVYEDGKTSLDTPIFHIEGIVSGLKQTEQGGLPAPAQFSIFRSKFLHENGLEFVTGILHEDSEFKPRATYFAKSITSDDVISYNYLQRTTNSITAVFKLKNAMDEIKVMNLQLKFCDDKQLPHEHRVYVYRMIGVSMNTLLYHLHKMTDDDINAVCDQLRDNKHLFKCMLKSKKTIYVIESLIFMINIKLGVTINNLLRKFYNTKVNL